jgi:transcriptional regulator with XRE-family HTH domain
MLVVMEVSDEIRQRAKRLPSPPVRKALRIALGFTLDEAAVATSLGRSTVIRYENGLAEPRGLARARYASWLADLECAAKEGGLVIEPGDDV